MALVSLVIPLPKTLTVTATAPAPTLTARERIIGDESETTSSVEAFVIVEPLTRALVSLIMTLADSATPTPTPPAATPKERASMVVLLVERMASAPPASRVDPEITSAVEKLVIIFPEKATWTPTPPAATPPVRAIIFAAELAVISRLVPLVTSEASTLASTVLTIRLAAAITPTPTPPAATPMPKARMVEVLTAEIETEPPASTSEPPSTEALTILVISLP